MRMSRPGWRWIFRGFRQVLSGIAGINLVDDNGQKQKELGLKVKGAPQSGVFRCLDFYNKGNALKFC